MIVFPPAKHTLHASVSLNAFASKVATSAVIAGHSSICWWYFQNTSIVIFGLALFHFSLVTVGDGANKWISVGAHRCRSKQIFDCTNDFLPEFSQTCPKSVWATFCAKISHKTVFRMTSTNRSSCDFGRHVLQIKHVGRHFCPNFHRFCSDFHRIKTFGGASATPAHPPPYQWARIS